MKYRLDGGGYVIAVAFGCYLDYSLDYTGTIPSGYKSLDDWATHACIQAYYIDRDGNLVLDFERKLEIENRQEQELINNSPVLRKDIFDTEEAIEGQYMREIAAGKVVILKDIKTIAPKVKITGIKEEWSKFSIYAQGKNMLPCDAVSCVVSGVTFTKNASGSITVLGTAKQNIEYVIADGKDIPLFALKANHDYYLNLGGLQCELSYYNGETTAQQYIGASGLLRLPEHIEVTKVTIKIASGDSINKTFYPQLEYGNAFTSYESHKIKALDIHIEEMEDELVLPADDLYASDTLYPGVYPKHIEYILVEDGKISMCIDGRVKLFKTGSMGLFSKYNTIYATKDVDLEIEYSANFLLVDSLAFLQGKATTTNRFKILEDGSISATNGYFKGRIEADSGYFKGDISWGQINDAETYVTRITKNTVTTAYINALKVQAGSVRAEDITGTYISGKHINGATISGGTIDGVKITGSSISIGSKFEVDSLGNVVTRSLECFDVDIWGGTIGGMDIKNNGIMYGKTSIYSTSVGIYIGKDGISVGYNDAFRVTSDGDVQLKADFTADKIEIGGYNGTKITSSGIDISSSVSLKSDGLRIGTTDTYLTKFELKVYGTYLDDSALNFKSSSSSIKCGYTTVMSFSSYGTTISGSVTLGGSYSKIGFFGSSGASKKSVSTLYSYDSSVSSVSSKLNELINALKNYNLI